MINLPAILIANSLGAALMLILIFSNQSNVHSVFFDEKVFHLMCLLTLFLCLTETIASLLDGWIFPGARFLLRLFNMLPFAVNTFFSVLWTVYIDYKLFGQRERLRRIYPLASIPALITMLLAAANLFTDVFFTLTPENIYQRTPLILLPYLVTYVYLAAGAWMVLRCRRKVGKYLFLPVVVFLTPVFLGSLLQLRFYGITLISVSAALGVTSLYINLQNEATLIDSLTKLYNREYLIRYLSAAIQHPPSGGQLAGFMMDLNSFKEINDTYGHSDGDRALRTVSRFLLEVLPANAFAARFGGDEFIILAVVPDEAALRSIMDAVRARAEAFNQTGALPYPLSFSMGAAFFNPFQDDQDSFLRRMDTRMYEEKRRYYSSLGNDCRRSPQLFEENR